jgi:hypothetical protein
MKPQLRFRNVFYLLNALLLAGLGLAAMILAMPAAGSGQNVSADAIVWLDGPAGKVDVGDEITVTVRISDVVGLYGIDLSLHFTPTDMAVVDAGGAAGIQIAPADCPEPDFVVTNEADNTAGAIEYVVTQLNPTPPFSGNCAVAYIRFEALRETSTTVRFTGLILSDNNLGEIPADTVGLTLNIEAGYYYNYVPIIIGKAN